MFKYNEKELKNFTEMNKKAWNTTMPLHQKANQDYWEEKFADKNFMTQNKDELQELQRIGFIGKNVVQFCCNNGVELLSLKRLGAARCVGFDISDKAINEAQNRAKRFEQEVEYYITDVYDISNKFDNQFDLAYITIGAIGWLPDLVKFFQIINRLLKKNGQILFFEQHPFSYIFAGDGEENPLEIKYPYFSTEPEICTDSLDYIGNSNEGKEEQAFFLHTLGDIIEALLMSGFIINGFKEYDYDISACLREIEAKKLSLPLSYILTAKKI